MYPADLFYGLGVNIATVAMKTVGDLNIVSDCQLLLGIPEGLSCGRGVK